MKKEDDNEEEVMSLERICCYLRYVDGDGGVYIFYP